MPTYTLVKCCDCAKLVTVTSNWCTAPIPAWIGWGFPTRNRLSDEYINQPITCEAFAERVAPDVES
jgi:hypothetical protein